MVVSDPATIRAELEANRIRTVLAVRASRIGDLLMTTPALRAFKERWPDTSIRFLTNPYSKDLLEGNPDVDDVVVLRGRAAELAGAKGRRLAASVDDVDLLLALRPRPQLLRFAEMAGIPYLFPRENPDAADRQRHVVAQGCDRLAPLDVRTPPGPLVLEVSPREREEAGRFAPPGEGPLLVAHPGCDETIRRKTRRGVRRRVWPVAHWRRFVDDATTGLGARVVLTSGSRVEGEWVDRIVADSATRPAHVRQPTLRELGALLSSAAVVVTVDTGPLHVATAVGTPLVGLYGPSPVSYTGPWSPGGRATVLRRELPCAPCQGRNVRCLRNVCMEEITVDSVIAACAQWIGAPPAQD